MSKYVFDIETNGYLWIFDRCWIVYLQDIDTKEKFYYLEGDEGWREKLGKAEVVIGHNIIGFDLLVLKRHFDFDLPHSCRIHDTLLMSQVLNYKRFGDAGHSLKVWGLYFEYDKLDFEDFHEYSEEMLLYCERDVDLNLKVYNYLLEEFTGLASENANVVHYLQAEHAISSWCAEAEWYGWPFDEESAKVLFAEMTDKIASTTELLESKLGIKTVAVDACKGEVPAKEPKWKKNGDYNQHTANWFRIDPEEGQEDAGRLVDGSYSRVEFHHLKLSSVADVKIFLFREGWVPTQYNSKQNPVTFEKVRTTPKITDDSLEFLGGDGKLYSEYRTIRSRHSILNTWLENIGGDGCLRGSCFTLGTPSMRARHKIVVNVPSSDSLYGPEMRSLFKADKGWKVVGCDSSGNQARGLAHYLNNDEFTRILLHEDIHTYNASKLEEVLGSMGIDWDQYLVMQGAKADAEHSLEEVLAGKKRSAAKRILYAFLFGASGGKLWGYIFGVQKDKQGNTLKKGFTAAVPGFKALLEKLAKVYRATSTRGNNNGYIPSIGGVRIYVDSFHKLLVYLLQSCEKATCAGACLLLRRYLQEEKIPYKPCIFMHDELDFQVPEEFAERAAELGQKAFQEGPKLFGITIMDGEGKTGDNWYEVH
jgi:hypothetical protein